VYLCRYVPVTFVSNGAQCTVNTRLMGLQNYTLARFQALLSKSFTSKSWCRVNIHSPRVQTFVHMASQSKQVYPTLRLSFSKGKPNGLKCICFKIYKLLAIWGLFRKVKLNTRSPFDFSSTKSVHPRMQVAGGLLQTQHCRDFYDPSAFTWDKMG
jgi:hypothetical protein